VRGTAGAYRTGNLMKTGKRTYDLVVESEDRSRNVVDTIIYALFTLSAMVSIAQFALQPLQSL
jgi:hypothetical protein